MATKAQLAAKAKAEEKKQLAVPGPTELAAMPDFLDAEDIGGGLEEADGDSFATPFLRILHSQSPACDEGSADYVEGARPGMFMNSVTKQLYDGKAEGVTFLMCHFQRRFLLWGARDAGGGYKGEFMPEEVARMRAAGELVELEGKLLVPDKAGEVSVKMSDRMADTRSHFGLLLEGEKTTRFLFPLTSTQIKKSKQLLAILSEVRVTGPKGLVCPPTWLTKIHMTTAYESNDQGNWYGVKFEAAGLIASKTVYDEAKEFKRIVSEGAAGVNYAEVNEGAEGDAPAGKF